MATHGSTPTMVHEDPAAPAAGSAGAVTRPVSGVPAPARNALEALVSALGPISWGTTYYVTTAFLPPDRPLLTATLRVLPIGLVLAVLGRRLPRGEWWGRILALGALNIGLFMPLLFLAAYRLPGGVAATIGAVQPLAVALLGWPLLGDRPTARTFVAAAAGVAGVALLVLGPEAALDAVGVLAALAATLAMAVGTVLTKRWGRPAPLLTFTAWQLVAGGLMILPLAFALEGAPPRLSAVNVAGYLYLGLVNTGLAYALWFRGVERLTARAASFLILLSPVSAVVIGVLLNGERLDGLQSFGMLLILGAIGLAQGWIRLGRHEAKPAGA